MRRRGFTLIEVLAVMLLTGLVLGVALDFYVNLSRASQRATDHVRDIRRATAVLDRVARDLEGALLISKPPDVDPLAFPWIFLAESRYADEGADYVKFVTRSHRPASADLHESDLAVVSYTVRRDPDERLEVLRSSTPRMPESLDRDFPRIDDDDLTPLLADGVASFGMTFLADDGAWSDTWDSSLLVDSSELPRAVEIHIAMAPDDPDDFETEPVVYRRRVLLPVRPHPLEELLDPARGAAGGAEGAGEEEGDGDGEDEEGNACVDPNTVSQCLNGARIFAECPDLAQVRSRYGNLPITGLTSELRSLVKACPALPRDRCGECL